jgi:hypothetical protein
MLKASPTTGLAVCAAARFLRCRYLLCSYTSHQSSGQEWDRDGAAAALRFKCAISASASLRICRAFYEITCRHARARHGRYHNFATKGRTDAMFRTSSCEVVLAGRGCPDGIL